MHAALVTTIDSTPDSMDGQSEPTVLILFNDRQGPSQVTEIMANRHAFVVTETWQTVDESDRAAFLLVAWCETANAETLFELIGSRLPDYIQARRFPSSRLAHVRATGTQVS